MNVSARQRAVVAYTVGAVSLLVAIVVAFALPTMVPSPCQQKLDCFQQLNTTKAVLVVVFLVIAAIGALLGGFRSYLADH